MVPDQPDSYFLFVSGGSLPSANNNNTPSVTLYVTDGGHEEDPVSDYRFCLFTIGTFFPREKVNLGDKWLEDHTRAYANAYKHY